MNANELAKAIYHALHVQSDEDDPHLYLSEMHLDDMVITADGEIDLMKMSRRLLEKLDIRAR